MCSYAGELYSKTMLDHLGVENENALYPEINGNVCPVGMLDAWGTEAAWSPAFGGGRYIFDDGCLRDAVTDDFAHFQIGVDDVVNDDDDDDVLLQNWSMEDLESLWMSADSLIAGAATLTSENAFPDTVHCGDEEPMNWPSISSEIACSPSSLTNTGTFADDRSTVSGTSGRLSRQSSFSSGRSSGNSSVAGSGYFRFDDGRAISKTGPKRLPIDKPSRAFHRGRHNSFGSTGDWQLRTGNDGTSHHQPHERAATTTVKSGGVGKKASGARYLTRQKSLESATCSAYGGRSELRTPPNVDDDDGDAARVACSEFVRLLLQSRNINNNHQQRPSNDEVDSGISDQLHQQFTVSGRKHHRLRRQPHRRSAEGGGETRTGRGWTDLQIASCPTSPKVKRTASLGLDNFTRPRSLNAQSTIDDTACELLSSLPVTRSVTSALRDSFRQGTEVHSPSSSQQSVYSQGTSSSSSSTSSSTTVTPAGCRHQGGPRRRQLDDHCYSRDVFRSEPSPSWIRKPLPTTAMVARKSNGVSGQVKRSGTSASRGSQQTTAGLVCSSVLELLLRSTGPLPANCGSDALVAEQLDLDATGRRSTADAPSVDEDCNSSDETRDAPSSAGDSVAPKGSTLLHRLLTEDASRMDGQLMSGVVGDRNYADTGVQLTESNSSTVVDMATSHQSLSTVAVANVDRSSTRATSLLSADRVPASDSSIVTSGDGKSTSSGEDSNCWPFGSFEWDDWGSSSASRSTMTTTTTTMMMTTVKQEGPAVDQSRQRWETDGLHTASDDEMALVDDNEQWMTQFFGDVFQL